PAWGLHLDEHRHARVRFRLSGFPDGTPATDTLYVGVGLIVGRMSGDRVPVIEGLPPPRSEDQLKALGAAAASSGSTALFHVVGVTPEAPTLQDALGGRAAEETIVVVPADVARVFAEIGSAPEGTAIGAVCLGTPHFSMDEWRRLTPLLRALDRPPAVPIYVNTARDTLRALEAAGTSADLQAANVTIVTDTCTYLTPILRSTTGVVMTNSGKWAYYAPANIGVQIAFG